MLISIANEEALCQVEKLIEDLNFHVVKIQNITESTSDNIRLLRLKLKNTSQFHHHQHFGITNDSHDNKHKKHGNTNATHDEYDSNVQVNGNEDTSRRSIQDLLSELLDENVMSKNKVKVIKDTCIIEYDYLHIRAEDIVNYLKAKNIEFTIENTYHILNNSQNGNPNSHTNSHKEYALLDIFLCLYANLYVIISLALLPDILGKEFIIYPVSFGIFTWFHLFNMIVTNVLLFVYGREFIQKAWKLYFNFKETNMYTLISIALISTYLYSLSLIIFGVIYEIMDPMYFEDMKMMYIQHSSHMLQMICTLITSIVFGKYMESKAKNNIYKEITNLKPKVDIKNHDVMLFIPKNRSLEQLDQRKINPIFVEKGDLIKAQKGLLLHDVILLKGEVKTMDIIQYGRENIETKTIGEVIHSGCEVIAEIDAVLLVMNPIEKSMLSMIYNEIFESSMRQGIHESDNMINKITKYFVNFIILASLITALIWVILISCGLVNRYGHASADELTLKYAFERALSVLVVSCPCALGIAVPIVYAISLNIGLANHILVKDGTIFQKINNIDTIIFDKTGTITGKYNLICIERMPLANYDTPILWEVIKLLESKFIIHPIGQVLYQESLKILDEIALKIKYKNKIYVPNDSAIENLPSEGLICTELYINEKPHSILLGNSKLLTRYNIDSIETLEQEYMQDLQRRYTQKSIQNSTRIWLCIDNIPQVLIVLDNENTIRPGTYELISLLKTEFKKDIYLVTGDLKTIAINTGMTLGIAQPNIRYEYEPIMKANLIKDLKKSGKKVMMIGDGLNDVKAYQESDVSIAINYKTSKNLYAAQVILLNNDLLSLMILFQLAYWCEKIKSINLIISFAYNIFAIPFAMGLFFLAIDYDLPPNQACWAMAFSSCLVILISLSLKLIKFKNKTIKKGDYVEIPEIYGLE